MGICTLCGAMVYWYLNFNGLEQMPFTYAYEGQEFNFNVPSHYPGIAVAALAVGLVFSLRTMIQLFRVWSTAAVAASGWIGLWWLLNTYLPLLERTCEQLNGDLSGLTALLPNGYADSTASSQSAHHVLNLDHIHCDSFLPELQLLQGIALTAALLILVLTTVRLVFRSRR